MKTITRIEPVRSFRPKCKAAAYCRVSTARESQQSSIENQRIHYEELIHSHSDWEMAGIYYEEGISATGKEKRVQLQRMLEDCRKGKIDLILTKSISRFARNTSDCLEMVRELTSLGVRLIFEKEGIDTARMESEFLLTVLASLAEEESRSISGNEQWAIRRRFENGTYHFSRAPYGYRLKQQELVIEPQEAAVVQRIFAAVLAGKGSCLIAEELNKEGIATNTKKRDGSDGEWTPVRIQSMIHNVIYTGDVLFQKTYRENSRLFLNNRGMRPQYYVTDHHPPIIPRDVFEKAAEAMKQRGKEKNNPRCVKQELPKARPRTVFTGKVICGSCSAKYRRQIQKTKDGKRHTWACTNHLHSSTLCRQKCILEEDLQNAFMTMLNRLCYAEELIVEPYIEEIRAEEDTDSQQHKEAMKNRLQKNTETRNRIMEVLMKNSSDSLKLKQKMILLENEASRIRNHLSAESPVSSKADSAMALREYLHEWQASGCELSGFPQEAFAEHVRRIIVIDRNTFDFELVCGMILRETLERGG